MRGIFEDPLAWCERRERKRYGFALGLTLYVRGSDDVLRFIVFNNELYPFLPKRIVVFKLIRGATPT